MSSNAYYLWLTSSLERLDELEQIHRDATGVRPGRRWGTEQFNLSQFVTLVAQFQTYSRNLHDESTDAHIRAANPRQAQMITALLTQGRKLETGIPRRSALGSDFGRLGFSLIDSLIAVDSQTSRALESLDLLIDFRNAISHGNETEILSIVSGRKIRATLSSYKGYRRTIERLVDTMDRVVATELASALNIPSPW